MYYSLRIQRFDKTKRKYILHTVKKTISVTLSVYKCFNSFWVINITGCVIQHLAERKFGSGHRHDEKKSNKPRVEREPRSAHGRAGKYPDQSDRTGMNSANNSLRTGSLRERKKIRRAKCESGSQASGSQSVNPRAKRVGCGLPPHQTAIGSPRSP